MFYQYVEDVLEKRKPYREAHIALANSYAEKGKVKLGGAVGNVGEDPDKALIVFTTEKAAKEFLKKDPYMEHGIVKGHNLQEFHVVVDGAGKE